MRAVVLVAVACGGGKPPAPPQACTKIDPIAQLIEAQVVDEAHSPLHAFEKTGDLMLRPQRGEIETAL